MFRKVGRKSILFHPSCIITSFSLVAGIGALMFYLYQNRRKCQGHKIGQGHRSLTRCTCEKSGQIYCGQHDALLIFELSKKLPLKDTMLALGSTLRIKPNIIEACRLDHKDSIIYAVYSMLMNHWYKTQDGLGLNSEGLQNLKRALEAPDVGQSRLVDSVIRTHFLNMDKD